MVLNEGYFEHFLNLNFGSYADGYLSAVLLWKNIHTLERVADPDPGSGAIITMDPGSGIDKNQYPGSGINIPDL